MADTDNPVYEIKINEINELGLMPVEICDENSAFLIMFGGQYTGKIPTGTQAKKNPPETKELTRSLPVGAQASPVSCWLRNALATRP